MTTEAQSEHRLHMADWKDADGGVVVSRFQPFCRCGWSPEFSTRDRDRALAQYDAHVAGEPEPEA